MMTTLAAMLLAALHLPMHAPVVAEVSTIPDIAVDVMLCQEAWLATKHRAPPFALLMQTHDLLIIGRAAVDTSSAVNMHACMLVHHNKIF